MICLICKAQLRSSWHGPLDASARPIGDASSPLQPCCVSQLGCRGPSGQALRWEPDRPQRVHKGGHTPGAHQQHDWHLHPDCAVYTEHPRLMPMEHMVP